ncbi:hypothetical protein [Adhaeretor mobilis]|uniref:Uncharacterized protein n=1 Tax=Adhaeretor mobilis TaxID=1930276 RepID=A0A517MXF7_9BACT|nr:hypothetical protein [Adhaeretor mobilis]QDS99497.1 hypothetical protein HG15A2_28210 [Adhaeretor mobilis]
MPVSQSLLGFRLRLCKLLAGLLRVCSLTAAAWLLSTGVSNAVTPESPEVRELIEKGLGYLESHSDDRLGGKCIIALAFHKGDRPDTHSAIASAVSACEDEVASQKSANYIYSKALAVILLAELDYAKHSGLIGKYVAMMADHQKAHGGFSYQGLKRGDTSQTQYAALAYWEILRNGKRPTVSSVEQCANWCMRTQDPSGAWAYQGNDPGSFDLQEQRNVTPCMLAAGLSSVMICGNMLGDLKPGEAGAVESIQEELPPELRPVKDPNEKTIPTLQGSGAVDRSRLLASMALGRKWMDKNFSIDNGGGNSLYYLYSLERYKSFDEYLLGDTPPEPEWYNKGYEFLKETQNEDGSWESEGHSNPPCSTAFAVLFLLRSTQRSLHKMGEGTLIGGRGLPTDLSKASFSKSGKLVVKQKPTAVDDLLGMLNNDEDGSALDALIDNPAALVVTDISPKESRRLEQVIHSGPPPARLLAVRALSRLRSLDYAPTLIYALTDPDPRIAREARTGLRSVSRKFEGFGMPDNFTEKDDQAKKFEAIDKWKNWYTTVRPDAPPLP